MNECTYVRVTVVELDERYLHWSAHLCRIHQQQLQQAAADELNCAEQKFTATLSSGLDAMMKNKCHNTESK